MTKSRCVINGQSIPYLLLNNAKTSLDRLQEKHPNILGKLHSQQPLSDADVAVLVEEYNFTDLDGNYLKTYSSIFARCVFKREDRLEWNPKYRV